MGFGDEILATGEAQRVYDADPTRRVAICDAAGAVRWHPLWDGNPILAPPADVPHERVQRIRNASGCRPYIKYPFSRDSGWTFRDWRATDHRGRLYLSPAETIAGAALRDRLGAYVLLEPSPKPLQPNRQWPFAQYQQVVEACPDLHFVQPIHDATRAQLPGVEYVASGSFRETCGLLASACAYLGPESGLTHAAAALGIPAVAIFGGCIAVSVMGYDDHVNLVDDDPDTPCGNWRPCPHCVSAMARIPVDQVVSALRAQLAKDTR